MYEDNVSALNAFSNGVAYTAHNVANVNTDTYQSRNFAYGAGPAGTVELQETPSSVRPKEMSGAGESLAQPPSAPVVEANRDSISGYDAWNTGPIYNNVSIERQMVNLIAAQNGFEANAVTIAQRAATEQDALRGLLANYRA